MNWQWLNPAFALSRLFEACGLDYNQRVALAAHFFAGTTVALLGMWPVIAWSAYVLVDEFLIDGWKGADTIWDLGSKLAGPLAFAGYVVWRIAT